MNILINGASRGIGKATALRLAAKEWNNLIVTGRDIDSLRSLSDDTEFSNIVCFELDITKQDERLKTLKNYLKQENRGIDILINCAGYLRKSLFVDSDAEAAREMMESNFFGPVLFIKSILLHMNRGSHIVNLGSMGGFQGSVKFPGLSWYSASKAALASVTESLAPELSEFGISVNCICPGAVQTEMLEEAFPGYKAPLSADEMAFFLADFAVNGHRFFNGKVLPVSLSTP
jgi:short-subunit dehydrogenase